VSEGDFLVRIAGQRTTFEARSIAAEEWLRESGRVTADAPRPYVVERDGPGGSIFLEALDRKGFVCRYENGATVERKVEPLRQATPALYGCGAIAAILTLAAPIYLVNYWSAAGPSKPTQSEIDERRDEARRDAERDQFEQQQAPLWKLPVSALDADKLRIELAKCREAINPAGASEAYLSDPDEGEALESARSNGAVTMTGQRRTPFGSVDVSEYSCHFRGAGFERVTSHSAGTMKGFVPG
jgi:hypothetical protein